MRKYRYADATTQTLFTSNNAQSLWQHGLGSVYRNHDYVMIPRFNARASDINLQIDLIRMNSLPVVKVLQRIEEGLAEDQRLTHLASLSDLEGFIVAMDPKQTQIDVRNAEAVFRQAEEDLQRAKGRRSKAMLEEALDQDHTHTVRTHNELAVHVDASRTARDEAYAILLGIKGKAAKAETREAAYNARLLKNAKGIAYVNHMLQSDFPNELLTSVLEAIVRTQRLRWRPKASDSLDDVVDKTFSWPPALNEDTRKLLRERARVALLNKAIIELPADFTVTSGTVALNIPGAISGKEQGIHHLVLDIQLNEHDNVIQSQLIRARRGMRWLALLFSNLQVFVVSLPIHKDNFTSWPGQSFTPGTLTLRSKASYGAPETLKTSLVTFINVLHAAGPGSIKFIHFVFQSLGDSDSLAHSGPLVRLPPFVAPRTRGNSGGFGGSDAATGDPSVGEQVLEQAYRYNHDVAPRS